MFLIDIMEVRPLANRQLERTFADGLRATLDMDRVLKSYTGIFAPLLEADYFQKVQVDHELWCHRLAQTVRTYARIFSTHSPLEDPSLSMANAYSNNRRPRFASLYFSENRVHLQLPASLRAPSRQTFRAYQHMTPLQLRARARRNLKSAAQLLVAGDADNAAQLAGTATELYLKARYCTRNAIASFPDTAAELRAAGMRDLATHDLEFLLTLCDDHHIRSRGHINWNSVSSWRIEDRYQPVGAVSVENIQLQVEETKYLLDMLDLYETIEGLLRFRAELEVEQGHPFEIFAINQIEGENWELLLASPSLRAKVMRHYKRRFVERGRHILDSDFSQILDTLTRVQPNDVRFNSFHRLHKMFSGVVEVKDSFAYGHIIKNAYLIHGSPPNRGHQSAVVTSCMFT